MWQDLEVTLKKKAERDLKAKPDGACLQFGAHFTDYMFFMQWSRAEGWHDAQIRPFGDFSMSPAAMVFHYGQAIFEGLKAYRGPAGEILLFRPANNLERMNDSAVRLCMPRLPVEMVLKSLKALVYLERDWVPSAPGATLYIRPTMIAAEPALGVRPADSYYFYIIMCPVGAYYPEGFKPTAMYVSEERVRAVKGGVGEAKAAGNYAASLLAAQEAKRAGCTQVVWLDGCEHKYIEEVGTSNIFFLIDDRLVTPALDGSILPGITRDSVIELAGEWGIEVEQRPVAIAEVLEAQRRGALGESFATGTAAVISPVGELLYRGERYRIGEGDAGPLSRRLFDELQAIQFGRRKDERGWSIRVC